MPKELTYLQKARQMWYGESGLKIDPSNWNFHPHPDSDADRDNGSIFEKEEK